ncbi:MAG: disulfide bond formation protein DsbD [Flavobacteriales bacterium]|nr:disulfide bond formation protein DsbD [Flavobacteriales bacterium]|tara:strand:+ start:19525 stop:21573 length:2049 start_codon:yes stop_codon:yes gene_type:complete
MKRYIALLFIIFFSLVLKAQLGDLATVDFLIQHDKEDLYQLTFKLKLKEGAIVYGDPVEGAMISPPELIINIDSSNAFQFTGDWIKPPFKTKFIKEFEGDVSYYQGEELIMTRALKGFKKDFTVSGNYQAQVCEEGRCITTPYPNPTFSVLVGEGKKDLTMQSTTLSLERKESSGNQCGYNFSKEKKELKTFNGLSIDEGQNESYFWFFIFAFVSGLVALLTPCVFPMIPMTVSFFLKESENKSKGKFTALIFGLSIIVIYMLIGSVINLIAGPDAANYIATHWLPNLLFFSVFLFFAASFFGMFELTLPSNWGNISDRKAEKGGLAGAFFMALTLSIVSFSCTGPIVGNVLVESVATGGIKPLIGMFGFSLAFALPFTFFAFFPSLLNKLPKSGGWLNSVKVVLGFIELALALKFLSVADQTAHWNILDREVYIALWIAIFSLMTLYLIGKIKFAHDSDLKFIKVPRLIVAIVTFAFVVYLLPGMWGAPLKGLSGYLPPTSTMDFNIPQLIQGKGGVICSESNYSEKLHLPHGIQGYFDYEQGMCCAKEQNKPVFIDFTGHGCVNCRKIEDGIWSDSDILQLLKEEFVVISLYIDEHTIDLPVSQQYTSVFDGNTQIKTLGQKNADIQKSWFNKISQPYYVTFDNDQNLLNIPIAFQQASDKVKFRKFLMSSIAAYKKRNP